MDIRRITPEFAVSPQIALEDVAAAAAQGFRVLIDNRPDDEAGPDLASDKIAAAARAAGMEFRYLPYHPGALTPELAEAFIAARAALDGPILAYCRSGTRSSHLWALSEAGRRPTCEIVELAARAGYDHQALIPLIEDRARG